MAVTGSPRKFTFKTITYNVKADANVNRTPEKSVEPMRHTGGNDFQETLEHGGLESLSLSLTLAEWQQLNAAANEGPGPSSFEYASGDVVRGDARVVLGNHESQTNKCDITVYPVTGKFEPFVVN